MFQNILVVGHSNIGDVCYDLAVVEPLHKMYPEARVTFLTSSRCKDIVNNYKGIDRVITFDRHGKDKSFFHRLRFISNLRKEKFDLAVVLKRSVTYKFLGISNTWRIKKDPLQPNHPVDLYHKLLRRHGIEIRMASFSFNLDDNEQIFCEKFLKKRDIGSKDTLIGILPLAAWSLKSWPIEKWNKLAKILTHQFGMKVINLGKIPANDLGKKISRTMADEVLSADRTTLTQAMALLQRCSLFIGPDSSFLHLASCMGIETIGLYGATSSDCFFPYFHRHNIVLPNKKLYCMPCYPGPGPFCRDGKTKPDFGPCMQEISVEDVLRVVKKALKL